MTEQPNLEVAKRLIDTIGAAMRERITPEERAVIEAAKMTAKLVSRKYLRETDTEIEHSRRVGDALAAQVRAVDALEKAEKGRTQDE